MARPESSVVAENRLPYVEELAPLFLEEGDHECGVVTRVGHLVADDESEAFAAPEALDEHADQSTEAGLQGEGGAEDGREPAAQRVRQRA